MAELGRVRAAVARDSAEKQRAEGALAQVLQQLKDEFGFDTVEEARGQLAELEREGLEAAEAFEAALTKFREEYEDRL